MLIKTEEGGEDEDEAEAELDVEGVESMEGETTNTDTGGNGSGSGQSENRESSIEPPRRRDSSDPVNLSINSGASANNENSQDIVHRLETSLRGCLDETGKYRETSSNESSSSQQTRDQQSRDQQR